MLIHIPSGFIIPLYIGSFVISAFIYFKMDPKNRVLNPYFGMMLGALLLTFAAIGFVEPSDVFFLLALVWLGLAIYLLRSMPPLGH